MPGEVITTVLRHLGLLLVARSLPVLMSAVAERRMSTVALAGLLAVVVAVVGATVHLGALGSLLWMLMAAAYYTAVTVLVAKVASHLVTFPLNKFLLFVILAHVFLWLPGKGFPSLARPLFMSIAWGFLLSTYSYCADVATKATAPSGVRALLFFVFVDPVLVYRRRARHREPCPVTDVAGAGRALLGAALLASSDLANRLVAARWPLVSEGSAGGAVRTVAIGIAAALLTYAAHSGLAHLQIGLMRVAGWHVHERYEYPLSARSPADFWQRWNVYVREWLELYLYFPLAMGLRQLGPTLAATVAAVVTLVGSGVLHDALGLLGYGRLSVRYSLVFLGAGALFVGWNAARALASRWSSIHHLEGNAVFRSMTRLVLFAFMCAAALATRR